VYGSHLLLRSKTKRFCYRSIEHTVKDVHGTILRAYKDYNICDIDKSMLAKYKSKLPPLKLGKANSLDLNSGIRAHTREEFELIWNFDPYQIKGIKPYNAFRMLLNQKIWKFQVLTSLAASDVTNFNPDDDLSLTKKGLVIVLHRHKKRIYRGSGEATPINAVVYPEAARIIKWFKEVLPTHKYRTRGDNRTFFGLIPIDEDSTNYASCNLNMKYMAFKKHLGLPVLYTHMPRRTCATILHQGGVPLLDIKRQLGDSTDAVVEGAYIGSAEFDFTGIYKKYFLEETDEDTVLKTIDSVDLTSHQAAALIKKLQESL